MNTTQFLIAAAAATAGGTIGAIGMALLSWSQIQASIGAVRDEAELIRKGQGSVDRLLQALDQLFREIGALGSALTRLRGALRIR